MRCYVINVPSEGWKLERTKQELDMYCPYLAWSIPSIWVASQMTESQFASLYDSKSSWARHNRDLSRGEIACVLSHQSALKEFLKTNDENCLIVEDDVRFSPIIGSFLEKLEGWLIAKKETPMCVLLTEAASVRYWLAEDWIDEIKRTDPIDIYGTVAYVVNRSGAEVVLKANSLPVRTFADDWAYYRSKGLTVVAPDKILADTFDFDRKESLLSGGRAEIYKQACEKRVKTVFIKRILKSIKSHMRVWWWHISGVSIRGAIVGSKLYKSKDRKDCIQ